MTTENASKRPTHHVFAVIKKAGAEKGNWVQIGAAWPHKDGKGFALKLDLVPLGDAELTLREIRSEGSEQ
jgi:hypothetical protein